MEELRLAEVIRVALSLDRSRYWAAARARSIGCTADAHEQGAVFGDEVAAAELALAAHASPTELLAVLRRRVGAGEPPLRRARLLAQTVATGKDRFASRLRRHCEAGPRLAGRLRVGAGARRALADVFERWDGRSYPGGKAREAIAPARVVQLAYDAVPLHRVGGADAAASTVAHLAGSSPRVWAAPPTCSRRPLRGRRCSRRSRATRRGSRRTRSMRPAAQWATSPT